MTKIIKITIEFRLATDIYEAIVEAKKISMNYNTKVEFEFNEILYKVEGYLVEKEEANK